MTENADTHDTPHVPLDEDRLEDVYYLLREGVVQAMTDTLKQKGFNLENVNHLTAFDLHNEYRKHGGQLDTTVNAVQWAVIYHWYRKRFPKRKAQN